MPCPSQHTTPGSSRNIIDQSVDLEILYFLFIACSIVIYAQLQYRGHELDHSCCSSVRISKRAHRDAHVSTAPQPRKEGHHDREALQSLSLEGSAVKRARNMKESDFSSKADLRGPQTKPVATFLPSEL